MSGWIKLYRKLLTSDMYRKLNSKQRDVMITLLLIANHQENQWEFKGQIYKVKPGQLVTSLEGIKENCASDVSIQNIRTALLKLEKWGFLTNESTKKNRLITIVNWDFYQGNDSDINNDINNQLTNSQQTANKQITTNKNDKNDKKIYEEEWLPHLTENGFESQRQELTKIKSAFSQKIGRGVFYPEEEQQMSELLEQGVQVETILEGIELAFNRYKPRRPGDKIRKFAYCYEVILDLYADQIKGGNKGHATGHKASQVQSGKNQKAHSEYPEIGQGYYDQFDIFAN